MPVLCKPSYIPLLYSKTWGLEGYILFLEGYIYFRNFDSRHTLSSLVSTALVMRFSRVQTIIMKTCPYNVYPLEPHLYIVKLGYAGVYLFFLIFS